MSLQNMVRDLAKSWKLVEAAALAGGVDRMHTITVGFGLSCLIQDAKHLKYFELKHNKRREQLNAAKTKITRGMYFEAKALCNGNKTRMAETLDCSREGVRKAAGRYETEK